MYSNNSVIFKVNKTFLAFVCTQNYNTKRRKYMYKEDVTFEHPLEILHNITNKLAQSNQVISF